MPSFYAVHIGRTAPAIFNTWTETSASVHGYHNSRYKKFRTVEDAKRWLAELAAGSSSGTQPEVDDDDVTDTESPSTPLRGHAQRFGQKAVKAGLFHAGSLDYVSAFHAGSLDSVSTSSSPGRSQGNAIVIPDSPPPRKLTRPPSRFSASSSQAGPSRPLNQVLAAAAAAKQPEPAESPPVELSQEQQRILDKVLQGKSLFFTGSAGTGKSVLMRGMIAALRKRYGMHSVAVTAPTGIAAVNVGGVTLHSFAGFGLGKEPLDVLIPKIMRSKNALLRWRGTRTLIIDEISMVDGKLFDKLEAIARILRTNTEFGEKERPFGGMQLVISGDFFQLPPVPDQSRNISMPVIYAFDSQSWKACVPLCYKLTRVFRQKEQRFVDMLNKMRLGELEAKAIDQFCRLSRPLFYEDGLEPTQLYPLKKQVETANSDRLSSLPGPTYTFQAVDTPGKNLEGKPINHADAQKILERLVALKDVHLRIGAQVMLIQNLKQGRLVNGSLGRIKGFVSPVAARETGLEIAKIDKGKAVNPNPSGEVDIRYHNSAEVIKSGASPVSTKVASSQPVGCDCDPQSECTCALDRGSPDPEHKSLSRKTEWPIVEFSNGDVLILPPVEFTAVNFRGITEATRIQIPLILAYALSIHKSQGQTLERVKVDLGSTFEKGQAYVALSRATSMQTLQVLNFTPSKVMAHPRVIEWSKTLRVDDVGDDSPEVSEAAPEDDDESDAEVYEDASESISWSESEMEIASD